MTLPTEERKEGDYHHPVESGTTSRESRQIPEAPWFLKGEPVQSPPDGSRPRRAVKPVTRYDPSAHIASTHSMDELWEMSANLPAQCRPIVERERVIDSSRGESAFILTIERALNLLGNKALDSINKEMLAMLTKKVFEPVDWGRLTMTQKKSAIRSSLFLKQKTVPEPKLKSRFVAGGHMQDKSLYATEEMSSPTVCNAAVTIVAAIAAREKRKVRSMDVGTAYLNADMKREVIMIIQPNLARIICNLKPEWTKFLRKDGCLVVRLLKALYGCVESAKLWYEDISGALASLGFTRNTRDECVFNVERSGHQVTVCLFVDDLLVTSIDEADLEWLRTEMVAKYKDVTSHGGEIHVYLGQTYDFSVAGEVKISMVDYITDAVDEFCVAGTRVTPATESLFIVNESSPALSTEKKAMFHSRVAKILYAALRSRPDVMLTVSFLTTRVSKSTEEDWTKLDRLLMYLNGTRNLGIVIRADEGMRVVAHIDASFAVHEDMKSHTGVYITIGKGPVSVSSKKQGLNTTSSTEAELVGISDGTVQVIWTREFLIGQGYQEQSALVYQDNTSTIALVKKGKARSARTRHIAIRYFFVKDRIEAKEMVVEHLGTDKIIADGLSKPLQGDAFRVSRDRMMGVRLD
jgi:hypothetical protein